MELIIKRPSGTGAVIVKETEFKNRHYIDIRYNYADKVSGELKPTRKGVALSYSEFVKLIRFAKDCREDEGFMENFNKFKNESVTED